MTGWLLFLAAFVAFLAAHALPMRPAWRGPLVARLGRGGYIAAYSLLSLALLYVLILAANAAPRVMLWPQAHWQRWVVNIAMPLAILIATFGTGAPNPFGTGGRAQGFDPDRPGIARITRHPLMVAFGLWAGAHLVANGDLAHVILFGAMLAFAIMGIAAAEARARRQLDFAANAAHTSILPGAALLTGRYRPRGFPSWRRLAVALLVWVALFHLHPALIGASPAP